VFLSSCNVVFYFFIISFSYKDKKVKKGGPFALYCILFFFSYFLNNKKKVHHLPSSIHSSLYFVSVFCAPKTTPKQSQNNLRRHPPHRCTSCRRRRTARHRHCTACRYRRRSSSPLPLPVWVGRPNMDLE